MDLPPSEIETAERAWPWRLAAFLLIAGAGLFRLFYLVADCPLDLAPDEAHYWHWSRHLDWSYYSKGPLVAYLIRLSTWLLGDWSRQLTGNEMAAVRVPAILCGALLLAAVYTLTVQVYRREKMALAIVALALTLPVVAAGSMLMTIDAPYTCCWAWALVFAHRAVFRQERWAWLAAGLCIAVGVLAKHTMVLWVPMFGLFLLCTPSVRGLLKKPGFWTMALIGALGGLPILLWNMNNDWVTWQHSQMHMGTQHGGIRWLGPLNFFGMQFALFLGYWFLVWAAAMCTHHPGRDGNPENRFLWFMSAPMILFFGLFSLKNGGGEPNWPITAYLSGMVLAGGWLMEQLNSPRPALRLATRVCVVLFCVLGLAATVLVHDMRWVRPVLVHLTHAPTHERPTPLRHLDPTCRLRGWRTLAAAVDKLREQLRTEGIDPVLAGAAWSMPGEIGFYCQGQPPVYSLGLPLGDRHSQYDLWHPNPVADYEQFLGKTFILVGSRPEQVLEAFDYVEPVLEVLHCEDAQPVAMWNVNVCRGYRGFKKQGGKRW